jgi:hypothetical protein
MAGAGYKLFNTGDVLTAAQVNTYLQEQTVMVFANAAARTTALASVLSEGMVSYLKDTNSTEVYDGSAWVAIGNSGDITGVTAGTGLTGGGSSGSVTLSLDSPVAATLGGTAQTTYATGDLLYASASNTLSKRSIGTTGQVLTVSGGVPTWATAAGGDLIRITTQTFTAASGVIFTDCFSSTYDNYLILGKVLQSSSASTTLRLRNSGGSDYTTADQKVTFIYNDWTTTTSTDGSSTRDYVFSMSPGTTQNNFYFWMFNPNLATNTQGFGGRVDGSYCGSYFYRANNSNAYPSLNLTVSSGTFTGEVSIYGYTRS